MRTDDRAVRDIARAFAAGRGRAWAWTTLREEVVDAEVMDHLRSARSADARSPTLDEIFDFRARLVAALATKGFSL